MTIDLSLNVAVQLAQRVDQGRGSATAPDQGTIEAVFAGYGLLGKSTAACVDLPALPVARQNLLVAGKRLSQRDAG